MEKKTSLNIVAKNQVQSLIENEFYDMILMAVNSNMRILVRKRETSFCIHLPNVYLAIS